jgi:hypothetical protein
MGAQAISLEQVAADRADAEEQLRRMAAEWAALNKRLSQLKALEAAMRGYLGLHSTQEPAPSAAAPQATDAPPKRSALVPNDLATESSRTAREYAVDVLEENGAPMDTWQLIKAMQAKGFSSQAANVYTTVFGALNRVAKRQNTRLTKNGNGWALTDWQAQEDTDSGA